MLTNEETEEILEALQTHLDAIETLEELSEKLPGDTREELLSNFPAEYREKAVDLLQQVMDV